MSSSQGNPSNKIGWYRKMCASIDRDQHAREVERRKNAPKDSSLERRKRKIEDIMAAK